MSRDVSDSVNMAGRWCSVVLLLSFLVVYLLNAAFAHKSDNSNNYLSYEGGFHSPVEVVFNPLVRIRRDDGGKEKKDDVKSDSTEKKATVPEKLSKSNLDGKSSGFQKTKLLKASVANASVETPLDGKSKPNMELLASVANPSAESPSSATNVSNATSTNTTSSPTSTTTTSTSTSNPITNVNITTYKKEDNVENSTEIIMPLPDSKDKPATSSNVTQDASGTENATSTETAIKNIDGTEVGDDEIDPDSGGDEVEIDSYNTSKTKVDHHRYYKSYTYNVDSQAQKYWVNLEQRDEVVINDMLSHSHRRAATVPLTFDFPFYGHLLRNITIATGGFIFTGDFVHTWLAATQYIAPLMANFDTSMSKDACVKYSDNGTAFTVQWDKVILKDHKDAGTFTFQVTLHKSGDITFTYKQIPVTVTNIVDDQHPVKVGLSDAYIVDRTIFYVRRKTIYEYHKIDMKKTYLIGNWTAIRFKALPTCVALDTCDKCLSGVVSFECHWCNKVGLCSSGLDRNRQDWLSSGCEREGVVNKGDCAGLTPPPTQNARQSGNGSSVDTFGPSASIEPDNKAPGSPVLDASDYKKGVVSDEEPDTLAHTSGRDGDAGTSVGGVVAVIFLLALVLGVGGWVGYAYFYPHSASGQLLIRYRPSTWSWRRGEARYTAAAIHSIHM